MACARGGTREAVGVGGGVVRKMKQCCFLFDVLDGRGRAVQKEQ